MKKVDHGAASHDFRRSAAFTEIYQHLNSLTYVIEKVIEERKKSFKEEGELEKIQNKRYLDFLDILLCAKVRNFNQTTGLEIG